MITVISATNRAGSYTRRVADYVFHALQAKGQEVQFFSLEDLPSDILHTDMYSPEGQSKALAAIQDHYMIPATKFYFVVPEYNGGYAGIFKLFIDAISIRAAKETFGGGKKAVLLGVAAGRAGNLRGIDHLAAILNHLKINVMPNLQPISLVDKMVTTEGTFADEGTKKMIDAQIQQFIDF